MQVHQIRDVFALHTCHENLMTHHILPAGKIPVRDGRNGPHETQDPTADLPDEDDR
jgi:hypothetical protein